MTENQIEEFLTARREEGRLIDPATAETTWKYGQILDPYGIFELSPKENLIGRVYFARRPGSDVWVELGDLPKETREALHKRGAFPPSFSKGAAARGAR
jgi:hypothetical protein